MVAKIEGKIQNAETIPMLLIFKTMPFTIVTKIISIKSISISGQPKHCIYKYKEFWSDWYCWLPWFEWNFAAGVFQCSASYIGNEFA